MELRTVGLDELAHLLTTFDELADKRQARCWSPTRYADGVNSRGNAGVESVSCLVFDCDRVPPDPERLEGVCWIDHTTYQHTPEVPRWRVVIPLARPVAAKRWAEVWQRARAALCPEADPSCKDSSRQYYLPSHPRDAACESTVHAGPLLDPATLPELPPAPRPPKTRRVRGQWRSAPRRGLHGRGDPQPRDSHATGPQRRAQWRGLDAGATGWPPVPSTRRPDALYAAAEQNGLVADDGQR